MKNPPTTELLSFLVPAYREAATIATVLERVLAVPTEQLGFAKEIVVCDDASGDGTGDAVRACAAADPRIRLVTHERNRGKGAAVRSALAQARGGWTVVQDADLEYDPNDILPMLETARAGALAVYGSRFLARRRPQGMRLANWLCNRILTGAANLLYGHDISDEATCYKLVRADVMRAMALESSGFELCPEMTAKLGLLGVRIAEVPIRYRARSHEEGKKIRWTDGVIALLVLMRYRVRTSAGLLPAHVDPAR